MALLFSLFSVGEQTGIATEVATGGKSCSLWLLGLVTIKPSQQHQPHRPVWKRTDTNSADYFAGNKTGVPADALFDYDLIRGEAGHGSWLM